MKRLFFLSGCLLVGCATPVSQTVAPTAAVAPPPTTLVLPSAVSSATLPPTHTPLPAPSPTVAPTQTQLPTPTPTLTSVKPVGYLAYTWQNKQGEAEELCSSAAAIASYNHTPTLAAAQPVIVPLAPNCSPSVSSERMLIERGNPARPRVALTLDAGASAVPTPKMLATLRDHQTRITFFLTGQWMLENPALVREMVADGHEIANHSLRHPDFTKLSDAEMLNELAQTEEIAQGVGAPSVRPFFRPPFGAYNKHVLDVVIGAGYLPIYWTVDSLDSVGKPKSAAFLADRVTEHLPSDRINGAIFLMHCGSEPTAEALPIILERFAARGIEVTTVSRVLGE